MFPHCRLTASSSLVQSRSLFLAFALVSCAFLGPTLSTSAPKKETAKERETSTQKKSSQSAPDEDEDDEDGDAASVTGDIHPDSRLAKGKRQRSTRDWRGRKIVKGSYVTLPEIGPHQHPRDPFGLRQLFGLPLDFDLGRGGGNTSNKVSKTKMEVATSTRWTPFDIALSRRMKLVASHSSDHDEVVEQKKEDEDLLDERYDISTDTRTDARTRRFSKLAAIIDEEDEGAFSSFVLDLYREACLERVWKGHLDANEDGRIALHEVRAEFARINENNNAASTAASSPSPTTSRVKSKSSASAQKSSSYSSTSSTSSTSSALWYFCVRRVHDAFSKLNLEERAVLDPEKEFSILAKSLRDELDYLDARRRTFDFLLTLSDLEAHFAPLEISSDHSHGEL
ncbi:unnamed protein product [Amoebophrya sp. A25]|nr:unnamed protein product [Amoebophrya sp. A25]|eukprot:GSA25T00025086001.1